MTHEITQADVDASLEGFKAMAQTAIDTHGSAAMAMLKDDDFRHAATTYELDMRPALTSQGYAMPTLSELLGVDITITER